MARATKALWQHRASKLTRQGQRFYNKSEFTRAKELWLVALQITKALSRA
jgi:hypothetical protein